MTVGPCVEVPGEIQESVKKLENLKCHTQTYARFVDLLVSS